MRVCDWRFSWDHTPTSRTLPRPFMNTSSVRRDARHARLWGVGAQCMLLVRLNLSAVLVPYVRNVINKKLNYRRETARRAILVNSCYVSRSVGVMKILNSKSDIHGHSRALTMVLYDTPHTMSHYFSIATVSLYCTVSEILLLNHLFPKI